MASSSQKSAVKANLLGKRKPEDGLETEPFLRKHKEKPEEKETTKEQRVELSEAKSDEANLISAKDTVEGASDFDEAPDFVEEPAVRKKTLYLSHISGNAEISDIIDFFKDVGQVVRVRRFVSRKGNYENNGFVEFASANEARKALEKKNGEYLYKRKLFIDAANKGAPYLPPKYCLDHKVWYEDNPQRERLPDGTPDFVEAVLFVANLSPQTTRISHIIKFFKDVAQAVSVRLIVNHKGKHVGYAFVEFVSAKAAKWALKNKNGSYLDDQKILLMKGQDETPDFAKALAVREKTLYVANLHETEISEIINFFKDVGQVVHVRLIVEPSGKHLGYGFVEFASANEAKEALEKKNGEYLLDRKIFLDVVDFPHPPKPKFCIDHKVGYEDYLRRESLLMEEDAAVEGLDETPDFAEEVSVREKTVFFGHLFRKTDIPAVVNRFSNVGKVVRVRLIVDHWGQGTGCGFVEFASADEAKKAVQEKNGLAMYVNMAEIAAPYPFRPKYNLYKLAKKLWYEDYLRQDSLGLEITLKLKKQKKQYEDCLRLRRVRFCGKKITFDE